VVLLPLEEQLFEGVIGICGVQGGEELLCVLLHLLGGQHFYN